MKKNNMKVGTKMTIGFAIVLVLVIILGTASYFQTQMLYQNAQTLYQHPLQVLQAVNQLKIDILNTRVGVRDLILDTNEQQNEAAARTIDASLEDGEAQFDIFYHLYLGPTADVDAAHKAYNDWRGATEYRVSQLQADLAVKNLGDGSTVGVYREELLSAIGVIESFAAGKADELNANFITLNIAINTQLLILCGAILALTVLISNVLVRAIRRPLAEMNDSITRFHRGEMSVRSAYEKTDEFGTLSDSFNSMADSIQKNIELHQKTGTIASVMLSNENAHEFFRKMLGALAEQTGAQMAAAYLFDADTKTYQHYESIGLDGEAKASFDAAGLEGLFGPAVLSGNTQIVRDIPENTKFVFLTPCCRFVPREIITIPILSGMQTIAVLSLASVGTFKENTAELIENIKETLYARIEGILAYRTIRRYSELLDKQNRELDAQKDVLAAQTNELTQQNFELEIQKQQLEEASRLKTSFLSNMSHELRTPLNSIIALSGVLNRRLAKKIPDEEYAYLDVIERNGKSLLQLINEILNISRIEAGREEVETSEFSMNELLAEIAMLLRPQADQKGIQLLLDENAPEIKILSDDGKCRHIMQNVIGNAVKFTEKGEVTISLAVKGDRVKVVVTDTGIGIGEKDLANVFDEFRQADGGTARRYGGSGLGLSIAKKYTELLGGTITVISELRKGSVFTISLPLRYIGPAESTDQPEAIAYERKLFARENLSEQNGEKIILLIEDSEPAIIQIKDLLEESGHQIMVARNAAQAFEIIKTVVPNAIILDLMMPEVDGFETLKVLRETSATAYTPVLILTAKHITREELKFLKNNHIYQLIQKGNVDRDELLNTVYGMLIPQKGEGTETEEPFENKPLVLVVEDNADNMITVKALLSEKYRVIGARDGEEGIAIAKEQVPDLILMDIALPGISGVDAFLEIRKYSLLDNVPVIALTASAMESEREVILSYGFDAFIAKPIASGEFYKVIGEVLYGR